MEETIQFIYQVIREYKVNIGGQINDLFKPARIAKQNPVIKNNFYKAISKLTNEGILEEREDIYFLTEFGFNIIYNQ